MKFRFASGPLVALAFAASATACGGEKPQPVTAATPPVPVKGPRDMSPVKAPPALIAWGRAADPDKTIGTAFGFVGLPAPGGETLGELLEMKEIAGLADMKAPLEAAVFLTSDRTPRPRVLVSIPVRSEAEAKQKLAQYKISETDGITTISLEPKADRDEESAGGSASDKLCLIAPAVTPKAGSAGHRLICGRKDMLDEYAPYMTRTLPTVPSSGAVYGEFFMKPLRGPAREVGRMANSLKILFDAPEFAGLIDLAIQSAADGVAFTQDLETAYVKADLTDAGARATMGLRFGGTTSTTATWLVSHPERSKNGPVGLDKTPADPSLAAFYQGLDLTPFDRALTLLHDQLVELAKQEKFPEAERTLLEDLLSRSRSYATHAAVSSRGFDDAAVEKALAGTQDPKVKSKGGAASQKARFAAADALEGWHAHRAEVKQEDMVKLAADWGKLLASPALKKWLTTEVGAGGTGNGNKAASGDFKKMLDFFTVKVKTSKAPASYGLPKGTDLIEITVPRFAALADDLVTPPVAPGAKKPAKAAPLPKPAPMTARMFVTADGSGTLSVYASDIKLAAAKMKEALAQAGAKSEPVAKLAAMKASGGGFATLRAGVAVFLGTVLRVGGVSERELRRFRSASKDQGVFFAWRTQAPSASAAGGSFEVEVEIPQKTIVSGISLVR